MENLAGLRVRDLEAGDGQLHEPLLLQVEGDGGAHRDLLVQGELGRDGEGAALHQRDGERLHVDADQSEMSTVDVDGYPVIKVSIKFHGNNKIIRRRHLPFTTH